MDDLKQPVRLHTAHPESAPGDFYVENACCTLCGVPQMVAPTLIGVSEERYGHCYWMKQPETQSELGQAFAIFSNQELGCHRYAGSDPYIQSQIGYENCDNPLPLSERVLTRLAAGWGTGQPEMFAQTTDEGLLQRFWRLIRRK